MKYENISESIKSIISLHFDYPIEKINAETTALDIPGWDSVENVALLMAIEDALNFEFDIEKIGSLENVGELIKEAEMLRKNG
ncbi:acyl carrier protein [Zhengella sp. ZM62]|uniref:acyl carrier protein n=1 Tax=Zhengella sedimenti TaxID=3390035 RepID=UPI0039747E97